MKNRLQQFIAAENISQSQFADFLNVARGSVSHIISGRNKPSYEFLQAMIERYPTINVEWLLTGKGKMYKEVTKLNEPPVPAGNLFSPAAAPADSPVKHPENEISADPIPAPVQKSQPESVEENDFQVQPSMKQRLIKKIVVFYTNGTFEEFTQ